MGFEKVTIVRGSGGHPARYRISHFKNPETGEIRTSALVLYFNLKITNGVGFSPGHKVDVYLGTDNSDEAGLMLLLSGESRSFCKQGGSLKLSIPWTEEFKVGFPDKGRMEPLVIRDQSEKDRLVIEFPGYDFD